MVHEASSRSREKRAAARVPRAQLNAKRPGGALKASRRSRARRPAPSGCARYRNAESGGAPGRTAAARHATSDNEALSGPAHEARRHDQREDAGNQRRKRRSADSSARSSASIAAASAASDPTIAARRGPRERAQFGANQGDPAATLAKLPPPMPTARPAAPSAASADDEHEQVRQRSEEPTARPTDAMHDAVHEDRKRIGQRTGQQRHARISLAGLSKMLKVPGSSPCGSCILNWGTPLTRRAPRSRRCTGTRTCATRPAACCA